MWGGDHGAPNDDLAQAIRNSAVASKNRFVKWALRLLGLAEWYETVSAPHRVRLVVILVASSLLCLSILAAVVFPVYHTHRKEGFDLLYNIVSPVFLSVYVMPGLAFFYLSQRDRVVELVLAWGDMFCSKIEGTRQPSHKVDALLASGYNSKWLVIASDLVILVVTLVYAGRPEIPVHFWGEMAVTHYLLSIVGMMLLLHFGWLAVWRSQFAVVWFLWRMRDSVLKVDPFAPDQVGGLRQLERLLTWVTLGGVYFASVFVFYFFYLRSRMPGNPIVGPLYVGIIAYIVLVILTSLAVPVFLVHRKMSESKRQKLHAWDLQIKSRLESVSQGEKGSLQELIAARDYIERVHPTMPMRWLRFTGLITISSLLLSVLGLITRLT